MRFFHRLLPAALALLSFALPGSALGQAPLSPDKAFALTVTREADGNLAFAWDIAPGHYLYRDHTVASTPGGKESLQLELAAGETKDDPGFGVVDVWHDAGRATLSAQTLTQAGEPTSVNITYQGCLEDSICYPPMTRTIDVPTRPQSDVAAREADAQTAQAAAMLAIQAPGATPAPENDEGAAAPSPVASSPAVTLDANPGFVDRLALQGGATWVLLAFFGFGVLLAFTPCVFPMYPILAGVIGRGVDGRGTRRGLTLSVAYVLGLSIAFALLGVAAAWSGQNLQMALQSVWAVGALAVVFVILAASMFGGFELQLPSTWTSRLSRDGGDGRRSLPSAAGLGFVSALIVGPCVTAPLAGALLYIAQTGDVGLGAAALFFLGLGKGAPLIVFGTVGARFLPKAGPWMDRVKMLFGFIFLGMAWWLASRVLPPSATLAFGAALALGLAAALGLFQPLSPNLRNGVARVAGLAAATWGLLLLVGLSLGADDPWRPLEPLARPAGVAAAAPVETAAVVLDQAALDRAVADAGARERPALVYFTADWCVSCKVIERTVFEDPAVIAGLSNTDLIKVDVTRSTPEARALLERHGVVGPPTMIFLSPSATEAPGSRLIGEMSAQDVASALQSAGAAA